MTIQAITPTLADTPVQASLKKYADALDDLRKHLIDVHTGDWVCSISGGFSVFSEDDICFLIQFHPPVPAPATLLCAKTLAKGLGDNWFRQGTAWEGLMRGFECCKIIIHKAEPAQAEYYKVEL